VSERAPHFAQLDTSRLVCEPIRPERAAGDDTYEITRATWPVRASR